ncbi:MAG: hypothetical protein MMC23_005392 [Stictis urceolatum]|nr:hypothetical protein [Stictis urceolata]
MAERLPGDASSIISSTQSKVPSAATSGFAASRRTSETSLESNSSETEDDSVSVASTTSFFQPRYSEVTELFQNGSVDNRRLLCRYGQCLDLGPIQHLLQENNTIFSSASWRDGVTEASSVAQFMGEIREAESPEELATTMPVLTGDPDQIAYSINEAIRYRCRAITFRQIIIRITSPGTQRTSLDGFYYWLGQLRCTASESSREMDDTYAAVEEVMY